HSSAGDGICLPHGVVRMKVSYQPSVPRVRCRDSSHFEYFSSQLRPELASHARPAFLASVVSRSSHLFFADHTCVRVVSVATSRPLRLTASSLPGGGAGRICSPSSIPHSSFLVWGPSWPAQAAWTRRTSKASLRMERAESTPRAKKEPRSFRELALPGVS